MTGIYDIYDLDAYDYALPEQQIAQTPAVPRDSSRLMVWSVGKSKNCLEHRAFRDIVDYLEPGDLLVLNDTRVLPARLLGRKKNKGQDGGKVEILLLNPVGPDFSVWKALVRPGRRLAVGTEVEVGGRALTVEGREDDGVRLVRVGSGRDDVLAFLNEHGQVPLPPYIRQTTETTREDYQTVFAVNDGSAAAPTAGLHFTEELLRRVADRGVEVTQITLHVGLGTFRPVKDGDIRKHNIHSEACEVSPAAADAVRRCRLRAGRVVAVGTTVARTLESMAAGGGLIRPGTMDTRLFIYPGFTYKVADALVTNFHLPKSSLLMLVAAFVDNLKMRAGAMPGMESALDALKDAYAAAIAEGYRFFSFGDAMFIQI